MKVVRHKIKRPEEQLNRQDFAKLFWGSILFLLTIAMFYLFGLPLLNKVMGVSSQLDTVPWVVINNTTPQK